MSTPLLSTGSYPGTDITTTLSTTSTMSSNIFETTNITPEYEKRNVLIICGSAITLVTVIFMFLSYILYKRFRRKTSEMDEVITQMPCHRNIDQYPTDGIFNDTMTVSMETETL